jgi:uncharacterized protein YndB with AHSA1/START domain
MSAPNQNNRIDRASRVIAASPDVLYDAFLDPKKLVRWLPPKGMTATVQSFAAVNGGSFRLSLHYDAAEGSGKTTASEDTLDARFTELIPGQRITFDVDFQSDDSRFAGTMRQVWTFEELDDGTQVTITCSNVPEGISAEDHFAGMRSTLDNLAAFHSRQR